MAMPEVSSNWTADERLKVIAWLNGAVMNFIQVKRLFPLVNATIGILEAIHIVSSYSADMVEANRELIEQRGRGFGG